MPPPKVSLGAPRTRTYHPHSENVIWSSRWFTKFFFNGVHNCLLMEVMGMTLNNFWTLGGHSLSSSFLFVDLYKQLPFGVRGCEFPTVCEGARTVARRGL
jgi:hypothetical protein